MLLLGTGTLNFNFEAQIVEDIYIRPGIGFMPFGALLDFGLWRPDNQGVPIVDRNISKGFYYDVQLRFQLSKMRLFYNLNAYVYSKFKHWNYDYETDFEVERFKVSGGIGKSIELKGHLRFDFYTGIIFSRDIFTYLEHESLEEFAIVEERNYRYNQYTRTTLRREFLFFEFGAGFKYGL